MSKYYVVWVGIKPGIYDNWNDCKAQVSNFPNAKYKSFKTKAEAEEAFNQPYTESQAFKKKTKTYSSVSDIDQSAIAVDAACSGNPGDLEYRGVWVKDRSPVFHMGPFTMGTNNIGEFLAIVHALALFHKQNNSSTAIYTDSKTAIAWVRRGKANTKLQKSAKNAVLFNLVARAEKWLAENQWRNPIIKWNTEEWGEIPADFGRK